MARPKIKIDPIEVEKLAAMWCTTKEIASFFDCSVDTIDRRFAENLAKGRDKGKIKLRRLQWQAAEKGNVVMLIFLGKQILDQRDSFPEENNPQEVKQSVYQLHTNKSEPKAG